jgi:predicted permease
MRWPEKFSIRLQMLFRRGRSRQQLDAELRFHMDRQIAENIAAGMSPAEARAAALRSFGNPALIRDQAHDTWSWLWLERVARDLRYAVRQLRKSPAYALTAICMLALGLGAPAAMYTVVDRVLLRPLPYDHPDQLVKIQESGSKGPIEFGAPYLDLRQWVDASRLLRQIAFYGSDNLKAVSYLESNAGVTHVTSPLISANLWDTLGVQPVLGRGFKAGTGWGSVSAEDANSILLSDAVWRTAYNSDPHILGKSVQLNGVFHTIIGVMPSGFTFPYAGAAPPVPLIWRPTLIDNSENVRTRRPPTYEAIARLAPGVSLQAAQAELSSIQSRVAQQYLESWQREQVNTIVLQPYGDTLVKDDVRKSLLALLGASSVLWLIACVNVAGLMLARASSRQREIAVRGALGASRWQIVRQLLIEGLLLSVLASLAGLALAQLTLQLFAHALTTQFAIHEKLTPSLSVLAALVGLTVLTALFSSLWPALGAARSAIEPVLRQGSAQSGAGRAQHRLRAVLVVSQIALSLTLLAACGLLLRTLYTLRHVPLGFRTDHIVVANMSIPGYKFTGRNMLTDLYQPLLDRAEHLPGVQSAALMTEVPLGKTFSMIYTFAADGNSATDVRQRETKSQFRAVTPEMQQVFGFSMARGRFFNSSDTPNSPPVVVVNRAFVRSFTGQDDPGKIIGTPLVNYGKNRRATVIGVLEDERQVSLAQQSQPEIEVCMPQITPDSGLYKATEGIAMDLAVRTSRNRSSFMPDLRQLLRAASPDLADSNLTTMDQIVEDSYGSQQLATRLLEIFGGCALLLCISGIYGLLAYLVSQRTRELGLRMALGAQRGQIMALVLRQAGWMLLAGSAFGLALAWFSSTLLRMFLYGVQPHDPWTMFAVTAVLLVCGLASAWIPARRAAAIDPMQALRTE